MTTEITNSAERLRNHLEQLTVEEMRHQALLALLGPIRDPLISTMEEIEVICQTLDAEWDWEQV